MAEETLVKEPLSRERIDAGRRLIELLDQNTFNVVCAFWIFDSVDGWRLVIATPLADSEDTRNLYSRVQTMLTAVADDFGFLSVGNIEIVRPRDKTVQALTKAFSTGIGVRITGSRLFGVLVEDAYLYRAVHP